MHGTNFTKLIKEQAEKSWFSSNWVEFIRKRGSNDPIVIVIVLAHAFRSRSKNADLGPQRIDLRRRTLGLFALFWFGGVIIGPLPGLGSKAIAQATQGSVRFDSCFVKGAHVPSGIKYTVIVDVTVSHPAFANPATTANLKVSDSAEPSVVIYNLPMQTDGGRRTRSTTVPPFPPSTPPAPPGPPTIIDPTFPLKVEVIINNPAFGITSVSLMLSNGSRARTVPATIDSPYIVGGPDWVNIIGQGALNLLY